MSSNAMQARLQVQTLRRLYTSSTIHRLLVTDQVKLFQKLD